MIWLRRYVGFLAALTSVVVGMMGMVILHYLAWRHFPSPLAYVTGIPNISSAPVWVHAWNLAWAGLPGVISFRWINSLAWRSRMRWRDAFAMWAAGGALTYILGDAVVKGFTTPTVAQVIALAIILTVGFGWVVLVNRPAQNTGTAQ